MYEMVALVLVVCGLVRKVTVHAIAIKILY